MKNVIITGATSGIGRQMAVEFHKRGYRVGATGRRVERLENLKTELGSRVHTQFMDVTKLPEARNQLDTLITEMGGMDIIVLNAGVSNFQGRSEWDAEETVIEVNIRGFAALANYSFSHFKKQGHGQIVGISSVAALFGYGRSAAYNASKAFVSTYLMGYRQKANHTSSDITVTDIKPGFVDSEMTEGMKGLFWTAETGKAVKQIVNSIEKKKNHAYITRRWRLVAWLIKIIPDWIWGRL